MDFCKFFVGFWRFLAGFYCWFFTIFRIRKENFIMKKLFEEHPCAGSFMGCSMILGGVLGLKIVTDFVFSMAVLFVDHNGSGSASDTADSNFEEE